MFGYVRAHSAELKVKEYEEGSFCHLKRGEEGWHVDREDRDGHVGGCGA